MLFDTIKFIVNHPLNQERKLAAISRFIKWQIGSRLIPGAIVFDWIDNSKFIVRTGETGLTGNIYTGLHEFTEMGFLLHVLRKEDLFIDIGANVGSYTILASAVVGTRGIAFEPVPSTYARLNENMRLNHLEEKVRCVNMGLGDRSGKIAFTNGDADTINHALAPDEHCPNSIEVDITTLDEFLQGEAPSAIKIDVEGFETPVLEGAKRTLANPTLNCAIVEINSMCNRYGHNESRAVQLMLDCGFRAYSYDPLQRKLIDLDNKNQMAGNILFVRNLHLVEERLNSTPKISIHGKYF